MKDGLNDLLQQAQKMQEELKQQQDKIKKLEVHGESGAGLVKITMTGRYDVKKVFIDDSLLKEDKEVMEDLVVAAVNNAVRKVEEKHASAAPDLSSIMKNMPGGFKFPM